MHARDATGRQVSLLNDDPSASPSYHHSPSQYRSGGDQSPLPPTPELLRSNSYDSNTSNDAIIPLTPGIFDYASRPLFEEYSSDKQATVKRPAYVGKSRSNSYEDDSCSGSGSGSGSHDKPGKRYPCRYRDTHGCEKTFTTSGHASRHSKIHTAEKAVQCTYPACHKKFTRADNMKQHLETHFKDKSRSSGCSKPKSSSLSSSKRRSVSPKSSSSPQSHQTSVDVEMWDADQFGSETPLPSPGHAWDMRGFNLPFMSRPNAMRTSSGLDALAMIACQEGA
ncbi:Uu.00g015610.m01.CDS01 [Anthostomella pinea]|uniref:C2H2 type master regulator of conidiophore development brlA n=1 Tax=Anthostomella pinea TaxID=933095 RepID=A0AAI8YN73_9PEZI|nr:Uu.00g015610.m01.CDS01 [Anthostomella pinea]